MLRKLLKYEFKATGRIFGLCYLALVFLALLSGISMRLDGMHHMSLTSTLLTALYMSVAVGVGVATLILILIRFKKNLLRGEGYLMNTLPVRSWQLLASKLIAAAVWCICGVAAALVSFLLYGLLISRIDFSLFFTQLSQAFGELGPMLAQISGNDVATMILGLLLVLFSGTYVIQLMYTSILAGHQLPKFKAAVSVLLFIVVFNILNVVGANLGYQIALMNLSLLADEALALLGILLVNAVLFFLSARMLERHLNLE